jgi:hypothetical protein
MKSDQVLHAQNPENGELPFLFSEFDGSLVILVELKLG